MVAKRDSLDASEVHEPDLWRSGGVGLFNVALYNLYEANPSPNPSSGMYVRVWENSAGEAALRLQACSRGSILGVFQFRNCHQSRIEVTWERKLPRPSRRHQCS